MQRTVHTKESSTTKFLKFLLNPTYWIQKGKEVGFNSTDFLHNESRFFYARQELTTAEKLMEQVAWSKKDIYEFNFLLPDRIKVIFYYMELGNCKKNDIPLSTQEVS